MQITASCIEPFAISINEAVRVSGLSRSEIYRRLSDGRLDAIKPSRSTLILVDSLRAHLASMPKATFRQKEAA